MKAADIRTRFLKYFEERGHAIVPSSSVVPSNDPTLFFVNAGMVQFKDVFVGKETRPYTRATTVQKCMRVSGKHNDLSNVGFTARHHTLFEMLGNFSFGDYFKEEAIAYAWEFLTVEMGLPADRLLVTIYNDDDESYDLWRAQGVPDERIGRCGEKDNFWSMGPTGPCGPCTEIHWDLQEDFVLDHEPDPWGFGHDAGRYMEIWNNVFMQYERYEEDGRIEQRDLPSPSVDTGMGLERLAAITQGHKSNWEIDELQAIIQHTAGVAGVTYGPDEPTNQSLRVVADHARASAFLVADGVMPSNEGRGYVLRRIMRRAIRHGVKLGIDEAFLHGASDVVVELMHAHYPELQERREFIRRVVLNEETTFRETLDRGLAMLDDEFARLDDGGVLPGDVTFTLHDTFGFPPDLTEVIASERGFGVDLAGYEACMEEQRQRSRAAWKGTGQEEVGGVYLNFDEAAGSTFTGYLGTADRSAIVGLITGGASVEAAEAGQDVEVIVASTPFYAEAGGQVGDRGTITGPNGRIDVLDCTKPAGSLIVHRGRVAAGSVRTGEVVDLAVDPVRRHDIMRNHTATHLLHAALREVLGAHVTQKGSLVDDERLRFDFSHFSAITPDELLAVEEMVNDQILANTPLEVGTTSMDDAQARGAMALFGEKYGDEVRVVEVPGFSVELCGGTHVAATGEIGQLKLRSEGGIAAGVRRLEALTGRGARHYLRGVDATHRMLLGRLKASNEEATEKLERLLSEHKAMRREIEQLKQRLVAGGGAGTGPTARDVAGVKVLATEVEGATGKELRGHADVLLDQLGSGIVVLGSASGGKASLLVKVSKDLTARVSAGDLVKELAPIVGGRGGGRPDMAQAGGREPAQLGAAIERSYELVGAALA